MKVISLAVKKNVGLILSIVRNDVNDCESGGLHCDTDTLTSRITAIQPQTHLTQVVGVYILSRIT